jgi:hypothetical protein
VGESGSVWGTAGDDSPEPGGNNNAPGSFPGRFVLPEVAQAAPDSMSRRTGWQ